MTDMPEDEKPDQRAEPETRRPMATWDRVKYLLLFTALFWFFVWSEMAENPIMSFRDALDDAWWSKWWLFLLGFIELTRQLHYVLSETYSWYHRFWTRVVFGGFNRGAASLNDWNRYRIGRALKVVGFLAVVSVVMGAIYHVSPVTALVELPARLLDWMPLFVQLMFYMLVMILQFVGLFWFLSRGGIETYFPEDIKTRFSDVWGQDPVLNRVKENVLFLEKPDEIEARGGYVPGGILLWGPPGTGKTLMAEAVAGETGRPYVFVEPGAFINMFFGVGVLKVKALFRKLRKLALRYGGVIVFFDEADALGNRGIATGGWQNTRLAPEPFSQSCNGLHYLSTRTATLLTAPPPPPPAPEKRGRIFGMIAGVGGGGGMGTLEALLTELSGLKKPRGFLNRKVRRWLGMKPKPPPKYRLLVIMATNLPEALDEALLRPGRIDRKYRVGYPSPDGRERTYRGYLAKINHCLTDDQIHKLALISPRATGASIKDIVNEALVVALRDGREVVNWHDIVKAKHLKTHGPADDWRYTDWEGHAVAVHEACHAVAMYRLLKREAIDVATIERRGDTGGFVAPIPLEEQFAEWRSGWEHEVMVFIASLAGERLFFEGDSSAGVTGDLRHATQLSMLMEGFTGMGQTVASYGVTMAQIGRRINSIVEDGIDRSFHETELGRRVEARLQALLGRVGRLLEQDRHHVLAVAHALEAHKTISGDDVVAIIEGTAGPLVDGTVYHDLEVRAKLDRYHASVVAAHQSQGRVELPLPEFNGHRAHDPPKVLAPQTLPVRSPAAGGDGEAEAADDREPPEESE